MVTILCRNKTATEKRTGPHMFYNCGTYLYRKKHEAK